MVPRPTLSPSKVKEGLSYLSPFDTKNSENEYEVHLKVSEDGSYVDISNDETLDSKQSTSPYVMGKDPNSPNMKKPVIIEVGNSNEVEKDAIVLEEESNNEKETESEPASLLRDKFIGEYRSEYATVASNITNPFNTGVWLAKRQANDAYSDLWAIEEGARELNEYVEMENANNNPDAEKTNATPPVKENTQTDSSMNEDHDADGETGGRSLRNRRHVNMNVDHLASSNVIDNIYTMEKDKNNASAASARRQSQEDNEDAPANDDICAACLRPGTLLCCETCTNSFHFPCVEDSFRNNNDAPDVWYCKDCKIKQFKDANKPIPSKGTGQWKEIFQVFEQSRERSFELSRSITKDLLDVIPHPETGEYISLRDNEVISLTNKNQKPEWEHPFGPIIIKEEDEEVKQEEKENKSNERIPLCYKCQLGPLRGPGKRSFANSNESNNPNPRAKHLDMVKCDFCPLYWHLDCLDTPSNTLPPAFREDEVDTVDVHEIRRRREAYWTDDTLPYTSWNTKMKLEFKITGTYSISKITRKQQKLLDDDIQYMHIRSRWMCPCHVQWSQPYLYRIENWKWLRDNMSLFEEASKCIKSVPPTIKDVSSPALPIKQEDKENGDISNANSFDVTELRTNILGGNSILRDNIVNNALDVIEGSGKSISGNRITKLISSVEDSKLRKRLLRLEMIRTLDNNLENRFQYLPFNHGRVNIENTKHSSWYFRTLKKTMKELRLKLENGKFPPEGRAEMEAAFNAVDEFVVNGVDISIPDYQVALEFLNRVHELRDLIRYDNDYDFNRTITTQFGNNLNPEETIQVPAERILSLKKSLKNIDNSHWDIHDIKNLIKGTDGKGELVNDLFNNKTVLQDNYTPLDESNDSVKKEISILPPEEALKSHNKRALDLMDVDTTRHLRVTEDEVEIFFGGVSKFYEEMQTYLTYRNCKKRIVHDDLRGLKRPWETPKEYRLDPSVLEMKRRRRGRHANKEEPEINETPETDSGDGTYKVAGTSVESIVTGSSASTYSPAKSNRNLIVIDQSKIGLNDIDPSDVSGGIILSEVNKIRSNVKLSNDVSNKIPIVLVPGSEEYNQYVAWKSQKSS